MQYDKPPPGKLFKAYLDGKETPYQKHLRFQQTVRRFHELSLKPTSAWSHTSVGVYQTGINVLQGCLKTMERLEGEELQAYANRFGVSKPELKEAIERLTRMREEVPNPAEPEPNR